MAEPKPVEVPEDRPVGHLSAAEPVLRRRANPANLLVAAVTLAAAVLGGWWLYDRLANVYILDAHIASDMLLLSEATTGVPWAMASSRGNPKPSAREGKTKVWAPE